MTLPEKIVIGIIIVLTILLIWGIIEDMIAENRKVKNCPHTNVRNWGGKKTRKAPTHILCGQECNDCGATRMWTEYR